MISRSIFSIALAVALTALPFASSADSYDERLAVAEIYVSDTLADMDMAAVIATMWQPIVKQVEAGGQIVSEAQKTELQALYMDSFEQPMIDILKAQSAIMADLMTLEEITALKDFYASDTGRSVMQKLPKLLEAQQPQVIALIQTNLPALMPKLQAILQPK